MSEPIHSSAVLPSSCHLDVWHKDIMQRDMAAQKQCSWMSSSQHCRNPLLGAHLQKGGFGQQRGACCAGSVTFRPDTQAAMLIRAHHRQAAHVPECQSMAASQCQLHHAVEACWHPTRVHP